MRCDEDCSGWCDVYSNPGHYGLTIVGSVHEREMDWEFHLAVVWAHDDGRVFYGTDSGCSCPSPFEEVRSLDELTLLTGAGWGAFVEALDGVAVARDYDAPSGFRRHPDEWADAVQLMGRVLPLVDRFDEAIRPLGLTLEQLPFVHSHAGRFHAHAAPHVPHSHLLRAVCAAPECAGFPTHDVHAGVSGLAGVRTPGVRVPG